MLKVTKIYKVGKHLAFDFNNSSTAIFHKFGKDIFTTVTENLSKKSLETIKKDIKNFDWDINKLEKIYL